MAPREWTLESFGVLCERMRIAQKRYFANRRADDLRLAQALERKLDWAIQDVLAPSLFPTEATDTEVSQ